ncbi:hypothetical protein [Salinibacterium sp.]|uniref:hypothetical protein n=1 Tax=Salinibacterium sp. TaxID=1915057 RepID=UPI00286BCA08|nr:hypothetical protein [Salinibacterium sp.]
MVASFPGDNLALVDSFAVELDSDDVVAADVSPDDPDSEDADADADPDFNFSAARESVR